MKLGFVTAARASRFAAAIACSLCFAMPCAASPFAADANGSPADIAIAADESVTASDANVAINALITTDMEILASASLPSEVSPWSVRGDTREERAPGSSSLRADSPAGMLESLLDHGLLVPEAERTYRALPGVSGTPAVMAAVPAPQLSPRDGSPPESTWRETGFNVMRWTSAALAVLAVIGIVIVLAMPGLRRRLFFPDLPPMPPRPA